MRLRARWPCGTIPRTRRFGTVCDTVVRVDGDGVLLAKNSDRDPNEAQLLEWHPPSTDPAGATVRCTWIEVPQVPSTRGVLISRPWWMWGAEMGANDAGVVIGNEAVFTTGHRRAPDEPGLLGMDLLRLALERSGNAEEAVEVIVGLLERHGQRGPASFVHRGFSYDNSFLVADRRGAIVLETSGRRWATEAVDTGVRAISNQLSIPRFADRHSDRLRSAVARGAQRRSCTEAAARRARTGVDAPLDLFAALRSHGDGPAPSYSLSTGAMGGPCMHAGGLLAASQTTASWVSDLRATLPGAPLHWATGTAAPCTSLFLPFRVHQPVELGATPTEVADPATWWWRHEDLHRRVLADPLGLLARYRHERDRVETAWVRDPPPSPAAVAEAEQLRARWLVDVEAGRRREHRPLWLRAAWSHWDRRAGRRSDLLPRPRQGAHR